MPVPTKLSIHTTLPPPWPELAPPDLAKITDPPAIAMDVEGSSTIRQHPTYKDVLSSSSAGHRAPSMASIPHSLPSHIKYQMISSTTRPSVPVVTFAASQLTALRNVLHHTLIAQFRGG